MYLEKFSLLNKSVIVTGATRGIGQAIAVALAEAGADVLGVGRSDHTETRNQVEACGRRYVPMQLDIADEDAPEKIVHKAVESFGKVDILVNAAGVNKLKKAEDYDAQTWDFVLGINLRALHLTTKEVGKLMIEQGYGRILSISSVKSLIGTDQDYIAYCASKGAVNMYTKQLACEWGKYGITVNAIAPTFTRTPINSFQLDDPAFYNKLVERIPRGRICTTKDLGCAAVYLCSDAAEFVSGQVLCVDGGLTAKQ